MLIGSKIPPQADIIKFVIAGGYDFSTCETQYVNLMFFCFQTGTSRQRLLQRVRNGRRLRWKREKSFCDGADQNASAYAAILG